MFMRNKNRIPEILSELEKVWKQNPDIRLGQLLINVTKITDIFYVEDTEMLEKLKEYDKYSF